MKSLLVLFFAYLLGSLPTAYVVARYKGFDIRRRGSGNIGTTNAFRTMGTGPGLLVLAVDVLKGVIPVLVGRAVGGNWLAGFAGLVAMAGHSWSVFLSFQGGRGVATAAGVLLALAPGALFWAFLIWLIVLFTTRYVSLSSIVAAGSAPFLVLLLRLPWSHFVFALVAAALIIYRHRPNIKRLLAGTEPKIGERG
ncbi:acyl-phosphate glycerol-3-phosphate acyltransferase [Thermanaeromonas toyohensis ToBE]|uniref:Glycerol-3-phosphate acyltransferase n=1 Tax=Thermanaeromonas toyohensis ToBE TaxID=698762 RepID=A0A1W1VY82_9FIRM|nr:glycerol-3-phosphate 1-O-acyltransferase PlsY [Thermanaeromonas toyohensis]SMB98308.1 acyl-phosphate glycerol-3-phosphate acyltransferase [Thermanaeromonas toyohensis ToBE]